MLEVLPVEIDEASTVNYLRKVVIDAKILDFWSKFSWIISKANNYTSASSQTKAAHIFFLFSFNTDFAACQRLDATPLKFRQRTESLKVESAYAHWFLCRDGIDRGDTAATCRCNKNSCCGPMNYMYVEANGFVIILDMCYFDVGIWMTVASKR
jgi:hypothetical protein